jgi:predicted O-linked N-acetylglucosamine transferase (SPINDLY family)
MTQLSDHEINIRTPAAIAAYHANNRDEAARICQEILAAMPTHPYALNLLAVMTMENGEFGMALNLFHHLRQSHPDGEQGQSNLLICQERMREQSNQLLSLAFGHYQSGRLHDAIDVYRGAIARGLGTDFIHGNLGAHLQDLGDWGEAEGQYKQALAKNPAHTGSIYNLGHLLSLQHRHSEAETLLRKAIELKPDYTDAHLALGHLLTQTSDLDAAMRCFDAAAACEPQSPLPLSAKLFDLAYATKTTAHDMHALAVRWAEHIGNSLVGIDAQKALSRKASRDDGILKVGFVSGDFKDHPVGYFTENLLRHANRERFEWHVFSNFEASDVVAARLRTLATSWTNIAGQSDEAARALIADKHIDILFDLSGHTALHRLPLFASRAAPVQVTWLGWHDTTGLANMDYLLTDRASMPPVVQADGSPYLSERALYLPRTRLCMMPPENAPAVAPLPMLAKGYITFGSMQILAKLSDVSLRLWAKILHEAPTAHLLIRTKQFREASVIEHFKKKCAAQGLPLDRVDLLPPLGRDDYLASYADIDILLDSYPYPGGTTTAEALWMGVPTITMGGNTMISCQGVSLLTAAGLTDWIAKSEANYIAKAVTWANLPEQLQALRGKLRTQVAGTALFDGAQFARDFEVALKQTQTLRV